VLRLVACHDLDVVGDQRAGDAELLRDLADRGERAGAVVVMALSMGAILVPGPDAALAEYEAARAPRSMTSPLASTMRTGCEAA
jgi:hypothetical protein